MMNIKINIYFPIKEGPWGGGNQFLKALREEWKKNGIYENNPDKAQVILFNSFEKLRDIINLKRKFPDKIFIHRVDGPIFWVRGQDKLIDREIFAINEILADGTIFQSEWSRQKSKEMGMKDNKNETIIYNAPDNTIFNKNDKAIPGPKLKIIASSWSNNMKKGFSYYKFLDENLDFSKYSMTFVGRSPITFSNINMISPQPSQEVAKIVKQHDLYITASKDEPCSNSLVEALSCGLPAIYLNSGGHGELVREGGESFNNEKDLLEKIDKMTNNYKEYLEKLPNFSMEETAKKYFSFILSVAEKKKDGKLKNKKITSSKIVKFYILTAMIFLNKIKTRLKI